MDVPLPWSHGMFELIWCDHDHVDDDTFWHDGYGYSGDKFVEFQVMETGVRTSPFILYVTWITFEL